MDNTVKENWIDKLVDELVDTKNELAFQSVNVDRLYTLIRIIFNNVRLDYSGDNMRIENDSAILEYLRVIDPDAYYKKLNGLKIEREAEIAKLNAAQEAKANDQGEKKEA